MAHLISDYQQEFNNSVASLPVTFNTFKYHLYNSPKFFSIRA